MLRSALSCGGPLVELCADPRVLLLVQREASKEEGADQVAAAGEQAKERPDRELRLLVLIHVGYEAAELEHEAGQHGGHPDRALADEVPDREVGALLALARLILVEVDDVGLDGGPDHRAAAAACPRDRAERRHQPAVALPEKEETAEAQAHGRHGEEPEPLLPDDARDAETL